MVATLNHGLALGRHFSLTRFGVYSLQGFAISYAIANKIISEGYQNDCSFHRRCFGSGRFCIVRMCVARSGAEKNSINDDALTCEDIKTQVGQLEEIRAEAEKGRTASGANVAAAIFFWPAVIGNYSNAQEALQAANSRQEVLIALAKKKRCKFA